MELTGKIINVLPERSGVSARTGTEWKCASYVLETLGEYPRRMVFEVFGTDRIAQLAIQEGELLNVSFDIDAREANGRWFNSIRAFRVDRNVAQAAAPQAAPQVAPQPNVAAPFPPVQPAPAAPTAPVMNAMDSGDQLPF